MSLKSIIQEKIVTYLTTDNSDRSGYSFIGRALAFLITHSGKTGRQRALQYQRWLSNTSLDERDLWQSIYQDFARGLGSSRQLRVRLGEGLCEFRNITTQQIDEMAHKLAQAEMWADTSIEGTCLDKNTPRIRLEAMRRLISRKNDVELQNLFTHTEQKADKTLKM